MEKRENNFFWNWFVLIAMSLATLTGFVLLFSFHIDHGLGPNKTLGMSRLAWLNIHRLLGLLLVVGVVEHILLHWKAFLVRCKKIISGNRKNRVNPESIMYILFFVAIITSLASWLLLKGSNPLFGPIHLGQSSVLRHASIDVHHITSIISFLLIVHHIGHRRRFLARPVVASSR